MTTKGCIVHVQTPTHVGSSGSGGSRSLDPAIRVSRKCRCSWHLWWILGGSSQESVQWVSSPQNWTLPLFTIYPTERTGVITRLLAEMILPLSKKNRPSSPIEWSKTAVGEKGWSRVFHGRPRCVCVWVFLVKNKQHKSSKECVWKWRIPPNNSNNPKYVFFSMCKRQTYDKPWGVRGILLIRNNTSHRSWKMTLALGYSSRSRRPHFS